MSHKFLSFSWYETNICIVVQDLSRYTRTIITYHITFFHLSGSLLIPFFQNCCGLFAKYSSRCLWFLFIRKLHEKHFNDNNVFTYPQLTNALSFYPFNQIERYSSTMSLQHSEECKASFSNGYSQSLPLIPPNTLSRTLKTRPHRISIGSLANGHRSPVPNRGGCRIWKKEGERSLFLPSCNTFSLSLSHKRVVHIAANFAFCPAWWINRCAFIL